MDMATALASLGVTADSIDDSARERLDRDGYALLPGVLSGRQVAGFRARLAELLASEGDRAGLEVHQEAGTDRLADLVNKKAAPSSIPAGTRYAIRSGCWMTSRRTTGRPGWCPGHTGRGNPRAT